MSISDRKVQLQMNTKQANEGKIYVYSSFTCKLFCFPVPVFLVPKLYTALN